MQRKIFNTTGGVFIALESKEFVLSIKKPFRTQKAAEKALEVLIYSLFNEPEKFMSASALGQMEKGR